MTITDWFVVIFTSLFSLAWCGFYITAYLNFRNIPVFEKLHTPSIELYPKISVLITACNEAATIQQVVNALLMQDYPELELVVINDRSTDNTGDLIDELARKDARIKVVHITVLPEKWLGKVHALHTGIQHANGDWLLFTDADVYFEAGLLRKAIEYSAKENCDHLALLPRVDTNNFWQEVAMAAFRLMFMNSAKITELNKEDSKAFVGVGAFNLVKKSILDKSNGMEWLRMEVIDDMGLGLMVRNMGGKTRLAFAAKHLNLVWYESLTAMFKGLEKNAFGPGTGYKYTKLVVLVLFLWTFSIVPLVALLYTGVANLWVLGIIDYVLMLFTLFLSAQRFELKFFPSIFVSIGMVIFSFMMIHAALQCKKQGGIRWRGTLYPVEDLIEGQRVKF